MHTEYGLSRLLFISFFFASNRVLHALSMFFGRYKMLVSQVDARKSDEVKNAVSEAVRQFGSLTAALNCAGSIVLKPAHSTSEAEFIATLETNLHSAFFLVKHAAPVIAKAGGGQGLRVFYSASVSYSRQVQSCLCPRL
jgi:NAD(P)-dependent dehydrogenase (short-subunit alcohol dehydrogenase family)